MGLLLLEYIFHKDPRMVIAYPESITPIKILSCPGNTCDAGPGETMKADCRISTPRKLFTRAIRYSMDRKLLELDQYYFYSGLDYTIQTGRRQSNTGRMKSSQFIVDQINRHSGVEWGIV